MKFLRSTLFFALVLLGTASSTLAQTSSKHPPNVSIVNVPLGALMNLNAYAMKGDIIRFQGNLDDSVFDTTFILRSHNQVLTQGTFTKQWHLDWNSAGADDNSPIFYLNFARQNGVEATLAHISVTVFTQSPIKFIPEVPQSPDKEPLKLKIACDNANLKPLSYTLRIDDKPVDANVENGQASIDLRGEPTGKRLLSATVTFRDRGMLTTPPVEIEIPHHVEMLPVALGAALPEGEFPLKIKFDSVVKPKKVEYYLDNSVLGATDAEPFDGVILNTKRLAGGEHTLYALIYQDDGSLYASPRLVVKSTNSQAASGPAGSSGERAGGGRGTASQGSLLSTSSKDSFVEWRDKVTNYISKMQRSVTVVDRIAATRFEGTAQVQNAIEELRTEIEFPRSSKTKVPDLDIPASMSDEDRRTAKKALLQIGKSGEFTEDAMRSLWNGLVILSRHDGNPDETPAGELANVRSLFNRARNDVNLFLSPLPGGGNLSQIASARGGSKQMLRQAQYNLDLIARRSGSKGN